MITDACTGDNFLLIMLFIFFGVIYVFSNPSQQGVQLFMNDTLQ